MLLVIHRNLSTYPEMPDKCLTCFAQVCLLVVSYYKVLHCLRQCIYLIASSVCVCSFLQSCSNVFVFEPCGTMDKVDHLQSRRDDEATKEARTNQFRKMVVQKNLLSRPQTDWCLGTNQVLKPKLMGLVQWQMFMLLN